MKKILVIKGSPRKNGFTNKMGDRLLENCKNAEIKVFDTYKESFKPCFHCNYCEKNGKCVNRDLDSFFDDFSTADIILFLSPIYNGTFPGPMKTLIDRFQLFFTTFYASGKKQQIEKRRKAYFVAASGRNGERAFQYMKEQLVCAFSILNVELVDSALCSYTDTDPNFSDGYYRIERSLTDDCR